MHDLSLYIVTFNCARNPIQPKLFASHLFSALPPTTAQGSGNNNGGSLPDIVVLSLQEVAPLACAFLGGRFLTPYLDNFRCAVRLASSAWQGSASTDEYYSHVISRNVGMTAIMVFARPQCADTVRWIDVAGVGTGLWEMGNKGAVGVRLGLSSPVSQVQAQDGGGLLEVTFVAAHLAPFERGCQKRNEHWESIVRRLVFVPAEGSRLSPPVGTHGRPSLSVDGEEEPLLPGRSENVMAIPQGIYRPTSHLFLAGDLNYRTNGSSPKTGDFQAYPQLTHDRSDPRHHSHLLKDDQLTRELRAGRTCHGLEELPIDFPPTYKYSRRPPRPSDDHHEVLNWAKWRWPSWCDRILFLGPPSWSSASGRGMRFGNYTALSVMPTSDHRPVAFSLSIPIEPIPKPPEGADGGSDDPRLSPPFPLDLTWREKRSQARRREVIVGIMAYLSLTWEGNAILLALVTGCVWGWWVIRALLP
jgi:hypothetical protein